MDNDILFTIETCIINNGNTMEFINPERVSARMPIVTLPVNIKRRKLLRLTIQQSREIKGIKNRMGRDYMISQFTDDTSMSATNRKNINHIIFELLLTFSKTISLKININKTKLSLLGTAKPEDIPKRYRSDKTRSQRNKKSKQESKTCLENI